MKKMAFCFVVFILLSGCAVLEPEEIVMDREYNRVILYNNSSYSISLEGFIDTAIFPGQGIEFNIPCYGNFELLAKAYRRVGLRKKDGEEMLSFYGERRIYISVDGRNTIYRNKSVDYYYEFTDYSFYPQRRPMEFVVTPKLVCGISVPVRIIH